jgi:DNA-binding response OmpR family regulator
MAQRILLVEDEAKTAETVRLYLERAGYEVVHAADGRSALAEARSSDYALVVLDLMLPEVDGLTVCRRLRAETAARIILLTARTTEDDRVRGLELGADDYVTKPFSPRELVARVRAVLRRGGAPDSKPSLRLPGELEIDRVGRRVRIAGRDVPLTATEFDLLRTLAESPKRVFRRSELIDRVLGDGWEGSERTIDAHVAHLRRKLETGGGPRGVDTVFGVGYRLSHDP